MPVRVSVVASTSARARRTSTAVPARESVACTAISLRSMREAMPPYARDAPQTIAVDVNPATREVATGTEVYTGEVSRRLATVAPDLRWIFYASRPRSGLGVDVLVLPFARLWSQVRLPYALAVQRPDLLFVPAHAV